MALAGAYVASVFKGKGLLNVGPHISITGKVVAQLRKWLPCEHDSTIVWPIQEAPVHRLRLTDTGSAEQVLHCGLGRHHVHVRVAVPRDEMDVGELELWP